jgi:hypothetical protein
VSSTFSKRFFKQMKKKMETRDAETAQAPKRLARKREGSGGGGVKEGVVVVVGAVSVVVLSSQK